MYIFINNMHTTIKLTQYKLYEFYVKYILWKKFYTGGAKNFYNKSVLALHVIVM